MHRVLTRTALLIAATISTAVAQTPARTASAAITQNATRRIEQVMPKVVAWRRDVHQNPELGNRERYTPQPIAHGGSEPGMGHTFPRHCLPRHVQSSASAERRGHVQPTQ